MFKSILVIAPHADDEVLGCGGFMYKQAAAGALVDVVVLSAGGIHHPHLNKPATLHERTQEYHRAQTILGSNPLGILYPNMDMRLDTIPKSDTVAKLEEIISMRDYELVLLPLPLHNHDHLITYECAFAALRPRPKIAVKAIACYEYGYIQHTPIHNPLPDSGKIYCPLNKVQYNAKLNALQAYQTQLRQNPCPTNEYVVETLCRMRALECKRAGAVYAEMFYLQKQIW